MILIVEIYLKDLPVLASMLRKSAPKERFFVGGLNIAGKSLSSSWLANDGFAAIAARRLRNMNGCSLQSSSHSVKVMEQLCEVGSYLGNVG
ncbi:MAG: hypothetical protein RR800_05455 [Comamonas sp.]